MSFSQVQLVFIVRCYLISCSYLACQINLVHDFFYSQCQINKLIFCSVKCFLDTGSVNDEKCSG
jgi:hypothetical protein